jgi:peptide/nickel transport system substrate-binding protein
VRLDGFKGALLSVLVMASIMASILVFFISITLVSATTSSTINKTLVKANTSVILTVTVTNSGTSPIDNVRIIVENGSGFAPLKTIPEDNIVRCYSDNVVVLPAGTVVQLLANENIILPEGTNAIVENGKHLWVENYLAFTILLENAVVAVRQDTVAENIPPGDNIGVTRGISVNLNNDNRLRLLEDTSVVLVGGNTVKLPENTLLQLDAQNDNSQIFGGENVTVAQNVPVTIKDNHVILVTNNPANTNFVNLPPGEYLQLYDNQVILASGTTVQLGKTATVRIAENESVVREMGKQLDVTGASVVNLPLNWMQTMGINDPLSYVPAVEWDGIGDNSIPVGGSLAFPFALTTPSTTEDRTPVRIWVRTPGSIEGPITLMVDGKAPTVSVTATPTLVKENTAVTITVVASEVLAKLENVLVAENNAPENSQVLMISTDNITWTGTYTTGDNSKRDGLATIYVIGSQFEDLVGNKGGGVTENTFTIDRCKPPAPNLSLISGLPPMVTNIGTWMIEGTALDNFLNTIVNLANGTVRVRVGTTTSDVTSSATGYFFKLITMTQGTQEIGIRFIDRAGNIGDENAENITFDNMPPVITPNTISGKPFIDGVVINDNTPTVNLNITDATLGIENVPFGSTGDNHGYSVRLRDENGVLISTLVNATPPAETMPKTISFENTFPTELAKGTYRIYAVAGDNLQMDNLVVSFVLGALNQHVPIYINGNGDFTIANGVNGGGSGTASDPYIIENWDISAENANGIWILNTTAYFVIRNCYVHDGSGNFNDGIMLDYVKNGVVENTFVENCRYGIGLWDYSSNIFISNNLVNNNILGVYLGYSDNCFVENNIVKNNSYLGGIYLNYSINNLIKNNTVENNSSYGIYFDSSENDNLTNNTCRNNDYGIYVYRDISGNNRIRMIGNTIQNNSSEGIYFESYICDDAEVRIIGNTIDNNSYEGIYFDDDIYGNSLVQIENNSISNNDSGGIYFWYYIYDDSRVMITGNTIDNNSEGIHFDYDIYGNSIVQIENNSISNNYSDGINFGYPIYDNAMVTMTGNTIDNNSSEGIYFDDDIFGISLVQIENNSISNNGSDGVYFGYPIYDNAIVMITGNTIDNNSGGIHLDHDIYGKLVQIENNSISNNSDTGIYLYSSVNTIIENNTCSGGSTGIFLQSSNNNILTNNTLENNFIGIELTGADNNHIETNIVENNSNVGIFLYDSVNNIMANNTCENNYNSIYLGYSDNNFISSNTAENNNTTSGITLVHSTNNLISGNTCRRNAYGIYPYYSDNNTISNNTVDNNGWGIILGFSDNNRIYHNNLVNNTNQAYDDGTNYWDDGYPSGGNYWSDYSGVDENLGVHQNSPGSDGIGDVPYDVYGGSSKDRYPLMNPWPNNPSTLVYETIFEPNTLDPAWAYDTTSSEVIQNVYETLISFKDGRTDEFDPKLAENWTISADGLTYTFIIRTGVKFQNGDNLTPQDVVYSIKRAMVRDINGGPVWMLLEPLIGVGTMSTRDENGNIVIPFENIDNSVNVENGLVVFHLKQPYDPFIQILAQSCASIVDENWCIAQGDWPGTAATYENFNNRQTSPLQELMNGTGPFKLDSWEHGVQVILTRNDNYWRTPTKLKSVVIKVVSDWTDRKLALLAGDADFVYVPRANLPEIENVSGVRIIENLPELTCEAIFFNFEIDNSSQWIGSGKLDGNGIPPNFFSDENVRLGFAYSFDWDTFIADAYLGQAVQPASPVIDGLPYVDPSAKEYYLDPAQAENHFRQAFGGALWENGFKLTILYNTGNDTRRIAAEILKQNIESLNTKFSITIESRDWATYLNEMVASKLTLYYLGWQADYADPHNFVSAFMSSRGALSAFQHYNNPTVDNLISAGIVGADPAQRQAIYYQLQQIYYDDVPSLPTAQTVGVHVERDWVNGWYYNPLIPGTPEGGDYYLIWKPTPVVPCGGTASIRVFGTGSTTPPFLWDIRKANVTASLTIYQGDNLHLVFLTQDNHTVENDIVIWSRSADNAETVSFTNLIVQHDNGLPYPSGNVKRFKMVLTDNAGNVILDNMAWYTVVQDDWSNRIIWIILNWGSHNSSQQDQLSNEISSIILNWGSCPTSRDQYDYSQL